MSFVEELKWRGMIHDMMPGIEDELKKGTTAGYIGFDPTSDSLHIGSLVQIMMLMHFQKAGHKPVALVGGATGMVGDPSGKSEERNLLSSDVINKNLEGIKKQLSKFLDFDCGDNSAEIVNNYDWFKDMRFLEFIRDIGKHISVNYMMAKDSVQKRLETGLSFTEFTYQLVQGYDFYHLYTHNGCKVQMGGSDQWGNIVTGTELIRRKGEGEAFALTCPLVTKADGGKFGKTEQGNVWLDREKTSPYKFYQFWLNCSDEDAAKYMRIFTLLDKQTIETIEAEHAVAPHLRVLQKALAKDVTIRVHSEEDYNSAVDASQILFGNSTAENLKALSGDVLLSVFEGVPQGVVAFEELRTGVGIVELLAEKTAFLGSNGEARRALKENSISINKEKALETTRVSSSDLIANKYLVLQRGKKNYFLVIAE